MRKLSITMLLGATLWMWFPATSPAQQKTNKPEKPNPSIAIQGIYCKEFVNYHPNGNILRCKLATPQTISNITLPENTLLCFNEDKTIHYFFLEKPTRINGHLCKGSGTNWMHTAYPNGNLKLIWLEEDETIQGIPCMAATALRDIFGGGVGVGFYENGKISRCKLAKDFTYQGRNFSKGDILKLDQSGQMMN